MWYLIVSIPDLCTLTYFLKRTVSSRWFFEYPQHMFWLRNKKNNFQLRFIIWGPVYLFMGFQDTRVKKSLCATLYVLLYSRYRVLAVDHDMFSFVDQNQGHWPVVMVTNPKHASMMSSNHEPLWRMMKSTHIR